MILALNEIKMNVFKSLAMTNLKLKELANKFSKKDFHLFGSLQWKKNQFNVIDVIKCINKDELQQRTFKLLLESR